ncbi:hypothetical protein BCV72DRAFT_264933 [Rhizopus microsporus var. microsporus]|uniref:Uncharacterized protein n=2 Tax=Rhizopus microsporus TaxID=58291 RepID=A0A2G4T2Y1_RHIZD|nr:uncharacterized protein RHIMIDRAFT_311430 [Rhizopus microsporus ATCC 52813]ORE02859.1 hypothetical protein BCV72DRAFT_264933 [Rhizopus microsporus var. microsporus]PHZ15369.1 hypothetical protein RHIMIDRAFT_311430 [Rhizopus microsporus ATCC 52813]
MFLVYFALTVDILSQVVAVDYYQEAIKCKLGFQVVKLAVEEQKKKTSDILDYDIACDYIMTSLKRLSLSLLMHDPFKLCRHIFFSVQGYESVALSNAIGNIQSTSDMDERNLHFSEFINEGEKYCQIIDKLWKEKPALLAQQSQAK